MFMRKREIESKRQRKAKGTRGDIRQTWATKRDHYCIPETTVMTGIVHKMAAEDCVNVSFFNKVHLKWATHQICF